jgi:hypothetical protein
VTLDIEIGTVSGAQHHRIGRWIVGDGQTQVECPTSQDKLGKNFPGSDVDPAVLIMIATGILFTLL